MDLTAARDEYCERLHAGLLAEPANLFSNLAFFVAATWLWRWQSRNWPGPVPPSLRALPVLIALIGLGSSAYHSFAQVWAEILDVGFIAVFIHWYVACFLRYRAGLRWRWAWLGIPGFALFGQLLIRPFPADALNGSMPYLPALAGMLLMWLFLLRQRQPGARLFSAAALVFLVSLLLRTGDQAWCSAFPLGTHWLWHCLNAVTLSLVTVGLASSDDDAINRSIMSSGPQSG